MAKRTPPVYPGARRQLVALGQRLRAARLRRDLTQAMLAERVGVTVPTIAKLESGVATTSLSTMLRVLQILGFASDIDVIAAVDEQGRALQDSKLSRATPKKVVSREPH